MSHNVQCQKLDLASPIYGKMKRIRVYLLDEPETCNVLNINPRNCRNWTEVLKHITVTLKPAFGAVLRVYELSTDKFVETFDELIPNEVYVALGAYGMVKKTPGSYTLANKREVFKPRERTQLYLGETDPKMQDFLSETEKKGLTVIYVMTNGVTLQVPQKVVFRKHELQSWDPIIRFLDQKLDIPEGVEHIATIFGDILLEPRELQHGFVYVALQPLKPFVELDYLELFKYLCSNYRGNYILSIEPAPMQTSQLIRRRTKSIEPRTSMSVKSFRTSEFGVEPRQSRTSEHKLSANSKLGSTGSTRDPSITSKRASTPDKTINRMSSRNRSIISDKKYSSESIDSRKSTSSRKSNKNDKNTDVIEQRKSTASTRQKSNSNFPDKYGLTTKNAPASSHKNVTARVSYLNNPETRDISNSSPLVSESTLEDYEDELADVYPTASTAHDKKGSRISKTRASQTYKQN